ncbi:MAG: hypothetical protein U0Y68_16850 [Blastocatellia bacterium]
MSKKQITEIEIERRETFVIRPARHEQRPRCSQCSGAETMLTPGEAARLAGVSQRIVFRWLDQGEIHFCETPEGDVYLCAACLPLTT